MSDELKPTVGDHQQPENSRTTEISDQLQREADPASKTEKPMSAESLRQVYDEAMTDATEAQDVATVAFESMVSSAEGIDATQLDAFQKTFESLLASHEKTVQEYQSKLAGFEQQIQAYESLKDLMPKTSDEQDKAKVNMVSTQAKLGKALKVGSALKRGVEKTSGRVKEKTEQSTRETERAQQQEVFAKGIERSGLSFASIQKILDAKKPGFTTTFVLDRLQEIPYASLLEMKNGLDASPLLRKLADEKFLDREFSMTSDPDFDVQISLKMDAADKIRTSDPQTYQAVIGKINQLRETHRAQQLAQFRENHRSAIRIQIAELMGPQMTAELLHASLQEKNADGTAMIDQGTLASELAEQIVTKGGERKQWFDWKMMMHLPSEVTGHVVENLPETTLNERMVYSKEAPMTPIELTPAYQAREQKLLSDLKENEPNLPSEIVEKQHGRQEERDRVQKSIDDSHVKDYAEKREMATEKDQRLRLLEGEISTKTKELQEIFDGIDATASPHLEQMKRDADITQLSQNERKSVDALNARLDRLNRSKQALEQALIARKTSDASSCKEIYSAVMKGYRQINGDYLTLGRASDITTPQYVSDTAPADVRFVRTEANETRSVLESAEKLELTLKDKLGQMKQSSDSVGSITDGKLMSANEMIRALTDERDSLVRRQEKDQANQRVVEAQNAERASQAEQTRLELDQRRQEHETRTQEYEMQKRTAESELVRVSNQMNELTTRNTKLTELSGKYVSAEQAFGLFTRKVDVEGLDGQRVVLNKEQLAVLQTDLQAEANKISTRFRGLETEKTQIESKIRELVNKIESQNKTKPQ